METICDLAKWIRQRDDFAVIPHVSPDGDALGSALALKRTLEKLGKRACICCQDPAPHMYDFVPGAEELVTEKQLPFAPKALLFEDVAALDRAGDRGALSGTVKDWAVLDHHQTNPGFAAVNVVDGKASATGVMALRLMDELGVPLDEETALYLYVAISTDTGNFSFSNTNAEVFEAMARILKTGLTLGEYSRLTFRMRTVARVRLLGKAIDNMRLYHDGKIALTVITREMFDECGASAPDTEGIVNTLLDMEGVKIAMTAESRDDGVSTKFSLRSVGSIDVSKIADAFGGGGHLNAAGMTIKCPMTQAVDQAVEAAQKALNE